MFRPVFCENLVLKNTNTKAHTQARADLTTLNFD